MNHCPATTKRMLQLIQNDPYVHLMLVAAALAPDGDNIDDDMTFEQAGTKVRRAARELRREAKRQRTARRRAFSAVGSLDRVDWNGVAYAAMCSINPLLDKSRGRQAATR
jgi:hypothetical protein